MPKPTTNVETKTKIALEEQLSTAYRTAVVVLTTSSILALAIFTAVWKLKV